MLIDLVGDDAPEVPEAFKDLFVRFERIDAEDSSEHLEPLTLAGISGLDDNLAGLTVRGQLGLPSILPPRA